MTAICAVRSSTGRSRLLSQYDPHRLTALATATANAPRSLAAASEIEVAGFNEPI